MCNIHVCGQYGMRIFCSIVCVSDIYRVYQCVYIYVEYICLCVAYMGYVCVLCICDECGVPVLCVCVHCVYECLHWFCVHAQTHNAQSPQAINSSKEVESQKFRAQKSPCSWGNKRWLPWEALSWEPSLEG